MSGEQRRHLLPLLDFICFVSRQSSDEQLRFPRRLNGSLTDRLHYSTSKTSSNLSKLNVNDKVSISLGHVVTKQPSSTCGPDEFVHSSKKSKKELSEQPDCTYITVNNCQGLVVSNESNKETVSLNRLSDITYCNGNEPLSNESNALKPVDNKELLITLKEKRAKVLKKLYIGKECLFAESEFSSLSRGCIIDIDAQEGKAQIVPYNSPDKDLV